MQAYPLKVTLHWLESQGCHSKLTVLYESLSLNPRMINSLWREISSLRWRSQMVHIMSWHLPLPGLPSNLGAHKCHSHHMMLYGETFRVLIFPTDILEMVDWLICPHVKFVEVIALWFLNCLAWYYNKMLTIYSWSISQDLKRCQSN